jgi:hypothetical protein
MFKVVFNEPVGQSGIRLNTFEGKDKLLNIAQMCIFLLL